MQRGCDFNRCPAGILFHCPSAEEGHRRVERSRAPRAEFELGPVPGIGPPPFTAGADGACFCRGEQAGFRHERQGSPAEKTKEGERNEEV